MKRSLKIFDAVWSLRFRGAMEIFKVFCFSFIALFAIGCASSHKVMVLDENTGEPIEGAFVFTCEGNMLNPFNSSALYKTDKNGQAYINESGDALLIAAGKSGYSLETDYKYRKVCNDNSTLSKVYLRKRDNKTRNKIPLLWLRSNMLSEIKNGSCEHFLEFKKYCDEIGVELKAPGNADIGKYLKN